MGIRDILNKMRAKKERMNEIKTEDRIHEVLEQRKKNSNERELERYYEEDRQERIKKELEYYRTKKKKEMFEGNTILKGKYLFKDGNSILKQKNIFTNNKKDNILKQKPMFMLKGGYYNG